MKQRQIEEKEDEKRNQNIKKRWKTDEKKLREEKEEMKELIENKDKDVELDIKEGKEEHRKG